MARSVRELGLSPEGWPLKCPMHKTLKCSPSSMHRATEHDWVKSRVCRKQWFTFTTEHTFKQMRVKNLIGTQQWQLNSNGVWTGDLRISSPSLDLPLTSKPSLPCMYMYYIWYITIACGCLWFHSKTNLRRICFTVDDMVSDIVTRQVAFQPRQLTLNVLGWTTECECSECTNTTK